MTFTDISALRKAGKKEEALALTENELSREPENIWAKRGLAWVCYDFLKENSQESKYPEFKFYLEKIVHAKLPAGETILVDSIAFQVGKMVNEICKSPNIKTNYLNELFKMIRDVKFTKHTEGYSFMLKSFNKSAGNWNEYIEFVEWWGWDSFRKEDYLSEEYNGKKMLSLAERVYIAYSKKLIEKYSEVFGEETKTIQIKIEKFILKLDELIKKQPEYQYPIYYKTKLLIITGKAEKAVSEFLPFARKKRSEFWVWEVLSDTFADGDERKTACLCKALTLKTKEDFLIKIREKLAEILIAEEKYAEAKTEIEKIMEVRAANNWKIPDDLAYLQQSDWYKATESFKNNNEFYTGYTAIAEEILLGEVEEIAVAVEYVNTEKKILNFVKDIKTRGFFNYRGLIDNPHEGDILKVRLSTPEGERYTALSAKKDEKGNHPKLYKKFSGEITITENKNFGLVDKIFVGPELIATGGLTGGEAVEGEAVMAYNKKKNELGWKAFSLLRK